MVLWAAVLAKWVAAIRTYQREIGETGARVYQNEWPRALEALEHASSASVAPGFGSPGLTGQRFGELLDASDRLERAGHQLDAVTRMATSDALRAALIRGMSRTYSENSRLLARAIVAAASAARAQYGRTLAAAAEQGGGFAALGAPALEALYVAGAARGAVASELYAAALTCIARGARTDAERAAASAALRNARSAALGLPADSPAVAAADGAILAEYHPAQALSCTAGAAPANAPFPQARLAVTYDLAPLVDRRRAQQFGPLATTATGLNYRLIERLRTIRAEPRLGSGPEGQNLVIPRLGSEQTSARDEVLPTGAQPCTLAYSAAAAVLILAAVRAERPDWSLDLVQRYNQYVQGAEQKSGNPDLLLRELMAEFESAYDAAPPETPKEFRAMALGDELPPDGYIVAALARVADGAIEAQLHAELAATGAARVPYDTLARELRVTQALRTLDAGQSLWRALASALRAAEAAAFDLAEPRRKAALLAAFRRTLAGVLRAHPPLISGPSLKLFAGVRT